MQTVYPLDGGWALKMTTAKWYTPSGRSIKKERKLLPDGRFVEVTPDSLETDSARKARPVYHSDAGRIVYGGGAITPDVVVKEDTLTTAEQTLAKLIAPKSAAYFTVIGDYALELRPTVKPNFTVQPAWRDELFKRMTTAGIQIDRNVYDAGQALINRELEQRVSRVAFGDTAAKRRSIKDDAPLKKAMDLLSTGSSQRDLLARAAVASRGTK